MSPDSPTSERTSNGGPRNSGPCRRRGRNDLTPLLRAIFGRAQVIPIDKPPNKAHRDWLPRATVTP